MWPCTLRLGMAKGGGFVWPSTVARAAKAGEWDSLEKLTAGLKIQNTVIKLRNIQRVLSETRL